jgi:DNA replication protein DnaC
LVVGNQGLGKTMISKNLVHQAVLAGHSALFITASDLLLDLNSQDTARALEGRLRAYTRPHLLAIEIGYLAYDAHAADLLYQIVSRRYEQRPVVVTTNRLQGLAHRPSQRVVCRRPGRPAHAPRRDHSD